MIKYNEVRIGNLVDNQGKPHTICAGNFLMVDLGTKELLGIQPIPLTVEWMAKLGFDWNPQDKRYYVQIGNTLYLEYDTDFDCFIAPESWAGSCPWNTVKHVHQLQNLYFALTGDELTIKN